MGRDKRALKSKLFWWGLKTVLLGASILLLFIGAVYWGFFGKIPTEEDLKNFQNETASLVLSDNGSLIGKFYEENRTRVEFEDFPKHLLEALIATEDARYFEHGGVDSRSLFRVLIKSLLLRQNAGGGSTLTQQLAKNMFGRDQLGALTLPVSKLKEVILASRLEEVMSKEEILTLYLNTVPFGENVFGVEAASRRFFNKSVAKLQAEESAVLVGLLKANTYYNPRLYPGHALQRRNVVLAQMEKYGYLDAVQTDELQAKPLTLDYANLDAEGPAKYFLDRIKKELKVILKQINAQREDELDLYSSGLTIETTLNLELQELALRSMRNQLAQMQPRLNKEYEKGGAREKLDALVKREYSTGTWKNQAALTKREWFSWKGVQSDSISVQDSIRHALLQLHAGVLAIDPRDGEVKVYVGGIDHRFFPYDQIHAQRQSASAFKPILYLSALEQGLRPCTYLDNNPIKLKDYGDWSPSNYDHSEGGKYSLAAALSLSKNLPTVQLYFAQDHSYLSERWTSLGFSQTLNAEPSAALGTTSASLFEMTRAYAIIANNGLEVEPFLIRRVKTSDGKVIYKHPKMAYKEAIVDRQYTDMMTGMLRKTVDEGTARGLRGSFGLASELAGKTGTSQDYGDAWFMSYSSNLVIGTRVGATYPSIHFKSGRNGSGSALALPISGRMLQGIERDAKLKKRFLVAFDRETDLQNLYDCPDHLEDSQFERLMDRFFQPGPLTYDQAIEKHQAPKKKKKKKGFFKRLFGKDE